MSRPLRPPRNWLQIALTALALLCGLLLRLYILREHPPWDAVYSDMRGYVDNANRILNGRYIPETFFQPVGFSALMAGLVKIGLTFKAIGPINVICGTLTAWFTGRIAAHVANEWIAVLATWVASLHFSAAYLGGYYMGETIYSFLLAFASWIAVRSQLKSWSSIIAYSLLVSVSFWLKGYALMMVCFALLFFALRAWTSPATRKLWIRNFAVLSLIFVAQPLTHREITKRTIGIAQATPSTSGLNMVEGKCPWKRNSDSRGYGWWSPMYVQQGKGLERRWDRPFTDSAYFQKQALKCVQDRPIVILESFRNISELFVRNHLWPWEKRFVKFEKAYEIGFLIFLFPAIFIGIFRLDDNEKSRRKLFQLAVIVPILTICAVVYIAKAEIRYRVPFDPMFIVLASAGWASALAFARKLFRALVRRGEP